jgi:hypothetical protein
MKSSRFRKASKTHDGVDLSKGDASFTEVNTVASAPTVRNVTLFGDGRDASSFYIETT